MMSEDRRLATWEAYRQAVVSTDDSGLDPTWEERLILALRQRGWTVDPYLTQEQRAQGWWAVATYDSRRIALGEELQGWARFTILAHEAAHALMHAEDERRWSGSWLQVFQMEVEAEGAARTLVASLGGPTRHSDLYVTGWSLDMGLNPETFVGSVPREAKECGMWMLGKCLAAGRAGALDLGPEALDVGPRALDLGLAPIQERAGQGRMRRSGGVPKPGIGVLEHLGKTAGQVGAPELPPSVSLETQGLWGTQYGTPSSASSTGLAAPLEITVPQDVVAQALGIQDEGWCWHCDVWAPVAVRHPDSGRCLCTGCADTKVYLGTGFAKPNLKGQMPNRPAFVFKSRRYRARNTKGRAL